MFIVNNIDTRIYLLNEKKYLLRVKGIERINPVTKERKNNFNNQNKERDKRDTFAFVLTRTMEKEESESSFNEYA